MLAYAISWLFWIPLVASSRNLIPFRLPATVFYNLAGLGPCLSAFILTKAAGGQAGVRNLVDRLRLWRVGLRWLVIAIMGPPALMLSAVAIHVLLGGAIDLALPDSPAPHRPFLSVLLLMPIFVLGEEIGWRGYALPKLQERHSALSASLILGGLWGCWHLPSFLMKGSVHEINEIARSRRSFADPSPQIKRACRVETHVRCYKIFRIVILFRDESGVRKWKPLL